MGAQLTWAASANRTGRLRQRRTRFGREASATLLRDSRAATLMVEHDGAPALEQLDKHAFVGGLVVEHVVMSVGHQLVTSAQAGGLPEPGCAACGRPAESLILIRQRWPARARPLLPCRLPLRGQGDLAAAHFFLVWRLKLQLPLLEFGVAHLELT